VWAAEGQWRGADGRSVREPSFVVEVVHPPRVAQTDSAIVAIIAEYKRRFGQESVLRVVTAGRAAF
jgi:Uma2 family endonuclease